MYNCSTLVTSAERNILKNKWSIYQSGATFSEIWLECCIKNPNGEMICWKWNGRFLEFLDLFLRRKHRRQKISYSPSRGLAGGLQLLWKQSMSQLQICLNYFYVNSIYSMKSCHKLLLNTGIQYRNDVEYSGTKSSDCWSLMLIKLMLGGQICQVKMKICIFLNTALLHNKPFIIIQMFANVTTRSSTMWLNI